MEEKVKYYMLTDKDIKFANVYSDFSKLKSQFHALKDKLPLKTWLLEPTRTNEDLIIAKVHTHLFACLGPKQAIHGDSYIKVRMAEIKVKL